MNSSTPVRPPLLRVLLYFCVYICPSYIFFEKTLLGKENMAESTIQPIIEAEADDYENDSALGDDATVGSTESISSSILKYRVENGRTYHAYKVLPFNPFIPNLSQDPRLSSEILKELLIGAFGADRMERITFRTTRLKTIV